MSKLKGKRVLITRAKEQNETFAKKLQKVGAKPVEIPLLAFQVPKNMEAIQQAFSKLHTYTWIVFTSVNGVHTFFSLLKMFTLSFPQRVSVAAVGTKTEKALQEYGIKVDLIPNEFVGEDLAEHLKQVLTKDDAVLLPRGQLARKVLVDELVRFGVAVTDVTIYETVRNKGVERTLKQALYTGNIDFITFTSPSTVRFFVESLQGEPLENLIHDMYICSIGPITTAELKKLQLPIDVEAAPYTIDGMIDKMEQFLQKGENNSCLNVIED